MNALLLLTAASVGQPPMTLPTAQPAPMPATQPMTGTPPATNGGGNGNGDAKEEEKKDEPAAPEPYALQRLLSTTRFGSWLDDKGIKVDGWIQGNYTASTANRNNLPITFNDRGDFWQFNQNYFRVAKEVDTSKDEFQLGFRTDWILPGSDARFSLVRGLWDDQLKPAGRNGALPNYHPIDLFQVYAEAFMPNLGPKGSTVRVGRFATHVGYELVQGAETPFLSRSYMFQYNPFTHSGVWAITPLNDTWTVSNGFSVGTDNFFGDPTNRFTYLGQLKWAPKDGKTTAAFNVVLNDNNYQTNQAFPLYNVYNAVITHNLTDKLTYVADATFSHMDNTPLPAGGTGSATWYGAAQYLIYKHCDNLTSNLRVELFEDTKGVRTGFKGLYTDVAYNLAYSPVRSLILRPGVRYDHNNTSRPFEGKSDLFTATMDVILRY
ncbi:porin [Gemmata sp. JC717]|uniref:Porin n=1 Tax=Gemmata algarum TaxID=2975278 RepID=A0ABU5F7F7_9BACT|nr:porin [Gemmata algarum]MDY3554189.1 porin [Gemmata algarum]MDY3563467.1 porin [Gemmata algarum]